MKPVLETRHLSKYFDGTRALHQLSISFEAGTIVGIIGPNGSGKSTLIHILTGFLSPSAGEIVIAGAERIKRLHPYDAPMYGMTRTFQNVRLFEQMSVLDNVLVVLTERSVWKSLFEQHNAFHLEKAEEALKKIGLWEKRNELAIHLSYGQRKLLELARVLAMVYGEQGNIQIIFLDEPFAGLFPEMVKSVKTVIQELRNQQKAIVLVEHNMDLIRELSDTVYVLDSGELLEVGQPSDVLSRKTVIEAYLGE